jgi:alpha-L-fucosidase
MHSYLVQASPVAVQNTRADLKMSKKAALLILLSFLLPPGLSGQDGPEPEGEYVAPTDPLVQEKLEQWRDLKFGLLMHWGLYAQLGIVESWALCSEDQSFQDRGGIPYTEFKEMYFGQIGEFDPRQFDPDPWAASAKAAGMRYVIFTTKHHDGFSMWDTRQTEFRITGPESPFRDHPRANVAKEVFSAFRSQGFMTGAYFSKADWHHPDYWSPLWATPNRNNNYDTGRYPEMWQRFRDFTFNQVEELMTTMGPMDVLWLDGGWVRPDSTINDEVRSWGFDISHWEQDIDMPRIASMARRHQPGLLIVDRTVPGFYEDYRTPEQHVPPEGLPYPFETNMTMTQSWGHTFTPSYKSTRELIHTLIDVVAKGGNFLLNVAPTPQGSWEEEAYQRLKEIGGWMEQNGEGIYGTRNYEVYGEGETVRFTQTKDGGIVYAFSMGWPGEVLDLHSVTAAEGSDVTFLGSEESLDWWQDGSGLHVRLPPALEGRGGHAWGFKIRVR